MRFSRRWWLWVIAGGALFAAAAAVWSYVFGGPEGVSFVLFLVLASTMGEVLSALSYEIVAPTRVTIRPGERLTKDTELSDTAEIVSGFQSSQIGRVRVHGETWAARHTDGELSSLSVGDTVRILGRDGLTLLIESQADA